MVTPVRQNPKVLLSIYRLIDAGGNFNIAIPLFKMTPTAASFTYHEVMMDENIVQFYGKDGAEYLAEKERKIRKDNVARDPEKRKSEKQIQGEINQLICRNEDCFYFERYNHKWKGELRLGVYYNPSVI